MLVKSRMTGNPFTVGPSHTVPEALAIMDAKTVRHLPVVDESGHVVGVISRNDINAAMPSKATSFSAGEVTYLLNKLQVGKVMSRDVITISPDALLEEVAVIMRDRKIEMLPVVESGVLVGVITESAILDAFIDLLGFRQPGTRLTLAAPHVPGALARIGTLTAAHHANITNVASYRRADDAVVVLGLNTTNTEELEAEFTAEGFAVIGKLINR